MGALIDAARAYGPATPVWVDAAWLSAQRVSFDSLPSLRLSGYHQISSTRAVTEGLQFRSLAESMNDAVAWWDAQTEQPAPKVLSRAREHELLTAWRAHSP